MKFHFDLLVWVNWKRLEYWVNHSIVIISTLVLIITENLCNCYMRKTKMLSMSGTCSSNISH